MEHLDLSTAVGRWLEGQRIDSDFLYDFPILWLGRIGEFLQFLGALAIVAEIAGPERLRALGARLRSEGAKTRAAERLRTSAKWMMSLWTYIFSKKGSDEHVKSNKDLRDLEGHPAAILNGFLAIAAGALAWWRSPFDSWWATMLFVVAVFYLSGFLVGPVLSYAVVVLATLIANRICEPMAHLLDQQRPDLWINVSAFVFVLVGFVLDMFAS